MICLSKAEERSLRHLAFNQSPPALAPTQTTCQDLNGIANLREYVDAGVEADDGGGGGLFGAAAQDVLMRHESPSPGSTSFPLSGVKEWLNKSFSHLHVVSGGDDQKLPVQAASPFGSTLIFRNWASWIFSVLVVSFVLNSLKLSTIWTIFSTGRVNLKEEPPSGLIPEPTSRTSPSKMNRRSSCASGGVSAEDAYNLPLHVGALFIILTVSFLGCAFPILATKFPGLRIPGRFFFIVRHFGTGVLIATAFVHLLPTAFTSLGNPCLGDFWVSDYPAMPGAIALAAVFLVIIVEMVFHPSRHIPPTDILSTAGHGCMTDTSQTFTRGDGQVSTGASGVNHPMRDMGPLVGRTTSIGQGLSQIHRSAPSTGDSILLQDTDANARSRPCKCTQSADDSSFLDQQSLSSEQKQRKDRLQCVLLEMGILFHSIFIGMALSVSIGNEFIVLLIAIIFHQTFEGLALGSRIANVRWEKDTWQPWLMALAYGCTTPLGQAIGLATHTLYSPVSEVGLIVVGVMNAISAGLLTFASLVELLSEDFLSDMSWKYLRGKERVFACLLVFGGAFGMSLVGAWA